MTRRWRLWLGLLLWGPMLAGCGTEPPVPVTVTLSPPSAVVAPGASVTFTAIVAGAADDGVVWSIDGGTLEVAGHRVTYTAPTTFGAYTVTATSVEDDRAAAAAQVLLEIRQALMPEEESVVESEAGTVRVQVPAGAVDAAGDLAIRSAAPEGLPEEAQWVVAAAHVSSSQELEQLARLSFTVPEEELAAGFGYQVFRRGTSSEPWERLSAVAIDGRLTVVTPGFSEFALAVTEIRSYDLRHAVAGFESALYGLHFGNDPAQMRRRFGDDAVESHPVFSGICYGMSMTASDYYAAAIPSPAGREHRDVATFGRATSHPDWVHASEALVRYASSRQNTQYLGFVLRTMGNWFNDLLNDYAMVTEVQRVAASVRAGHPTPVGVGSGWLGGQIQTGHVVLAYGARESYDAVTDELRIVLDVYDPNRYANVDPSTHQHRHTPATITLTVGNYEGGKRLWERPTVRIQHSLHWSHQGTPYTIDVLFRMEPQPRTDHLPRSNPVVGSLDVAQTDDVVRLRPTVTHASPGGRVTRLAWRVTDASGAVRSYGLTGVGAPATQVEIPRSSLGTGALVAHVMAQEEQGSWSNAYVATFAIHPGQLAVGIAGLPSGVHANVLVTGPNGYSRTLTNSTTLSLLSGTYTIAAGTLTSGGVTYLPSPPNQQRTVTSGGHASATVTYAVSSIDPGQLAVTIGGLPSGVHADVRVTGPNGYSRTLTSSTTLTLPPGTYTITGSHVESGGNRFGPAPATQQRAITSNGHTSATVTYAPLIHVTAPGSGVTWERGTTQTIRWTTSATTSVETVRIQLASGSDTFPSYVDVVGSTANTGSYTWTIPNDGSIGSGMRIRISDTRNWGGIFGTSGTFALAPRSPSAAIAVTSPTASAAWPTGTVRTITWSTTGTVANVRIQLEYGSGTLHEIAASTPNTGSFPWTVATGFEGSARIRVSDVTQPTAVFGWSPAFQIVPNVGQLTVTIGGLPGGVGASVLVTGPNGFSRSLTSSTTLSVPPGTYTIAASNVGSGGVTYVPSPTSQQRSVTSGGSVAATVTYASGTTPPWRFSPTQLNYSGDVGGSAPPTQTLLLINDSNTARSYTLTSSTMVSMTPTTGTIAAGASTTITVAVQACPNNDPGGTTTSTITATGGGNTGTASVARTCGIVNNVGMIQINITGLPTGVDANVTITGQGWYLLPRRTMLLADMDTGAYSMTAGPVTSGGVTYDPSPTQSNFTVFANQTTTVSIAYSRR
jgi:hypothetical protein